MSRTYNLQNHRLDDNLQTQIDKFLFIFKIIVVLLLLLLFLFASVMNLCTKMVEIGDMRVIYSTA